jgi:hypothetical protein
MNSVLRFTRDVAWWLVPLALLAVILGLQIEREAERPPAAPPTPAPAPVVATVLPEYTIPGGTEARRETVERTLFNPTRRPAPAPTVEAPKPRMQRGLYTLTGTTLADGKSTAFLRESRTGRSRRVQEGDTIDGMLVQEVKPDRVRLAQHGESEDLTLKVIVNPKPTPQPQVAAAPVPGAPGVPPVRGTPAVPGSPTAGAPPQPTDAQTLLERRRAARAAQAAAAAAQAQANAQAHAEATQSGQPAPPATAPQPGQPDQSGWGEVFRQYQQRGARVPNR